MYNQKILTKFQHYMMAQEGFVSVPAPCPNGYLTIGFGHKVLAGDSTEPITMEEAKALFEIDFEEHLHDAQRIPEFDKQVKLRQLVLVDMVFQMGLRGVLGFRKMRIALAEGDYRQAQYEMVDSRWYLGTPTDKYGTVGEEGTPFRALCNAMMMYRGDPGLIPPLEIGE